MSEIFQRAQRYKAKLKLAFCGPSGSGKTYSALLVAKGMNCGRIAMIDTENRSGELYADLAEYDVAPIGPPFSVDKYIGAIKAAEAAGYGVLIIDSLSHAWVKEGGILDEVDKRGGKNAFTSGWREATPMHNKLVDAILQSPRRPGHGQLPAYGDSWQGPHQVVRRQVLHSRRADWRRADAVAEHRYRSTTSAILSADAAVGAAVPGVPAAAVSWTDAVRSAGRTRRTGPGAAGTDVRVPVVRYRNRHSMD